MTCVHWLNDISLGLRALEREYRKIVRTISQGLHASIVACMYWLGDIGRGLNISFRRCRPIAGSTSQSLHASNVVCAHLSTEVRKWLALSSKECTHNLWHVCIDWATLSSVKGMDNHQDLVRFGQESSTNNMQYQSGIVSFLNGMWASRKWRSSKVCNICQGMHTSFLAYVQLARRHLYWAMSRSIN